MKKLLASILGAVGAAATAQPQTKTQTFDPKSLVFTTPTISNDLAPLEEVTEETSRNAFGFHEDEWCQIEFFPKAQLEEVQRLLREYKPFEEANRAKIGWRNVYVRYIQRQTVISGVQAVQRLEGVLGAKACGAPILFSSDAAAGRVKRGFSLPLGGNVTLYGYTDSAGIRVLAADVGPSPDNLLLTRAFAKLNSSDDVLLVDWRSQLVLLSVSASGQVQVWRP